MIVSRVAVFFAICHKFSLILNKGLILNNAKIVFALVVTLQVTQYAVFVSGTTNFAKKR